jgi:hypothetical protein
LEIQIAEINTSLTLDNARIDGDVLIGTKTPVTCNGPISIISSHIGGDLIIQNLNLQTDGVEVTPE